MVHGMKIYNLVRLPGGETLTESTDLPISNKPFGFSTSSTMESNMYTLCIL